MEWKVWIRLFKFWIAGFRGINFTLSLRVGDFEKAWIVVGKDPGLFCFLVYISIVTGQKFIHIIGYIQLPCFFFFLYNFGSVSLPKENSILLDPFIYSG